MIVNLNWDQLVDMINGDMDVGDFRHVLECADRELVAGASAISITIHVLRESGSHQ